jgi:RNA polymerase sigma factor (sigma-70 family)
MAAVVEHRLTDEQLAEQTTAGDARAFAALFERHLQGVYDLTLRVLRDEASAVDAVTESFALAWRALRRGTQGSAPACIYAAAYDTAVTHARRARGTLGGETLTAVDTSRLADPAPILRDPELIEVVWQSASALDARDYALLDLQLRKGLALNELAAELGFKRATLEARLSRLKEKLVASVTAARGAGPPTRGSPLAVFAAIAPVAVPPGLRDSIWARVLEGSREGPARHWKPSRALIVLAGVGALAGATAGIVVALGGGPQDPTGFQSSTHGIGEQTSDVTITVRWTPAPDAAGYSISWSSEPEPPDETVDLAGNQAMASRVVTPGQWWFNLRTRGAEGDWTHTVHIGPFVVVAVPNTTIASQPAKASNDRKPAFRLEASDEGTFECSLDAKPFEACSSSVVLGRLRDGRHRFEARIRDRYGNADASPAVWVWRVDTRAPQTRMDSVETERHRGVFRFSTGNAQAVFECRLDDGEYRRCKSPLTLRGVPDGDHKLFVRAADAAGNRDRSPAIERWTVDTTRPRTRIVSGPSGTVHRPTAKFALDANEDEVTYECSLDRRTFGPCSSSVHYAGLASGEHTFEARARDEAGNVDRTPARRIWVVVDTERPETTIVSHPRKSSSDTSPTFKFRSSEARSRFECRLDAGPWHSCLSPKTYKGLARGQHVFRVRARDASGNVDRTPSSWTWNIHSAAAFLRLEAEGAAPSGANG